MTNRDKQERVSLACLCARLRLTAWWKDGDCVCVAPRQGQRMEVVPLIECAGRSRGICVEIDRGSQNADVGR